MIKWLPKVKMKELKMKKNRGWETVLIQKVWSMKYCESICSFIVRLPATKPSEVNLGFQVRYLAGEKDLNKESFLFIVILITECWAIFWWRSNSEVNYCSDLTCWHQSQFKKVGYLFIVIIMTLSSVCSSLSLSFHEASDFCISQITSRVLISRCICQTLKSLLNSVSDTCTVRSRYSTHYLLIAISHTYVIKLFKN